jgi:hypothetical protein
MGRAFAGASHLGPAGLGEAAPWPAPLASEAQKASGTGSRAAAGCRPSRQ